MTALEAGPSCHSFMESHIGFHRFKSTYVDSAGLSLIAIPCNLPKAKFSRFMYATYGMPTTRTKCDRHTNTHV